MERIYNELEENLQIVLGGFIQSESDTSEEIRISITDRIGTELIYGLSFNRIHDANYLIGSCYGGGYEFIEWIEEDSVEIDLVTKNFKKHGLIIISVDSEL